MPGVEVRSEDLASIARTRPLTRGLGRSYGDASLPPPGAREVAGSRLADRIVSFDASTLVLRAEAGLALRALLEWTLPRGLWVPSVPGTSFVTLGGMVAADVHGKSHQKDGTLGRHVRALRLLTAGGDVVEASRDREPELFRATLGGMGLTGHILEVELVLQRIPSPWLVEEWGRYRGLDELLAALRESAGAWPYTVAWIDTLALHPGGAFAFGVGKRVFARDAKGRERKGHERKHAAHSEEISGPANAWLKDDLDSQRLRQLLAEEDAETRAIVLYVYFDDMTREETAVLVGLSVPTVRKRLNQFLYRARKAFGVPSEAILATTFATLTLLGMFP